MRNINAKYDYLIVGAGLFGSTFAYLASRVGKKCLVVDKRSHVGGNCYSMKMVGIDVHLYGPHIFHTNNKETWDFIDSLSPMKPFFNQPLAVFRGEQFNLPFNMNTFRQLYGNCSISEIKEMIDSDRVSFKEIKTLEEYALSTVGTLIYNKLIKGYTEKQWGRSCKDLPSSFIKRIPLRMSYDNCYFSDQYQGVPKNGYDHLFKQLLRDCDVLLNCDFLENHQYLSSIADRILYTGRLDRLYGEDRLEFRGLEFTHNVIDMKSTQGCAVVNYTDSLVPYTRITEHMYFNAPDNVKFSIASYEYPIECTHPDHNECYPIPTERNITIQKEYLDRIKKYDKMIFGGRLANYEYQNMDTTIEKAKELWNQEKRR